MAMKDVREVVGIHLRCFPGFFLSVLGERFLRVLYEEIVADRTGISFVCLAEGSVVGFVAGTDSPVGFYGKLLNRRWWRFVVAAFPRVVLRPLLVSRLLNGLRRPGQAARIAHECELMSLGVDPARQGEHLGTALVTRFLWEARARGRHSVGLTTDQLDNDRTNRFYSSQGFRVARVITTPQGRRMNEYTIALDHIAAFHC